MKLKKENRKEKTKMRKKLFAVIMSVMMMVTFMPAMAFANSTTDGWNEDFTKYEKGDVSSAKVVKVLSDNFDTTGAIKAIALDRDNNPIANAAIEYVDYSMVTLESVKYGSASEGAVWKDSVSYENADLFKLLTKVSCEATVRFTLPDDSYYATWSNGSSTKAEKGYTKVIKNNWEVEGLGDGEYDTTDIFTAQSFKLKLTYKGTLPHTGVLAKKSLTVDAKKDVKTSDAIFYIDGVAKYENLVDHVHNLLKRQVVYDGAEHSIEMKEIAGLSVTYKMLNEETGKFDTVEKPVFKNAGEYAYQFTLKTKDEEKTYAVDVKVNYANVTFAFDANDRKGTIQETSGNQLVYWSTSFDVHAGYNAADYVSPVGIKDEEKAAAETDKALLMEYFNDFYEIKQTPRKYDTKSVDAVIKPKTTLDDLTAAEKDALVTKYADLFTNYSNKTAKRSNITTAIINADPVKKNCTFFVDQTATDINWTKAPLTKTYKYKTLKKHSKTFKIKAKSSSSEKIVYGLKQGGSMIKINKTSGKVTVKKGLKKGTYNVVVSAGVWADKNNNSGSDSYTLKIRVK